MKSCLFCLAIQETMCTTQRCIKLKQNKSMDFSDTSSPISPQPLCFLSFPIRSNNYIKRRNLFLIALELIASEKPTRLKVLKLLQNNELDITCILHSQNFSTPSFIIMPFFFATYSVVKRQIKDSSPTAL